jgi:hypothetical protein
MKDIMNFDDFITKFIQWTEDTIEKPRSDLDAQPICPFARKARLQKKIQFLDARDSLDEIKTFDKEKFEIGIAWLGDIDDIDPVEKFCEDHMKANPELLLFTSTRDSGHFAKNFTDCVFVQLRGDILKKRKYLKTTNYYENWPAEYYKLITGDQKPV